jgi:hypothetical protein
MERHMVLISLAWIKIKWPRLHFRKKPEDIRKVLVLREAEKRMEKIRIEMDVFRRSSSLR